jgi:hypothetical protein
MSGENFSISFILNISAIYKGFSKDINCSLDLKYRNSAFVIMQYLEEYCCVAEVVIFELINFFNSP